MQFPPRARAPRCQLLFRDAGIQHRVWMTGKPARARFGAAQARALAERAAWLYIRTLVRIRQVCGRGDGLCSAFPNGWELVRR